MIIYFAPIRFDELTFNYFTTVKHNKTIMDINYYVSDVLYYNYNI